MLQGRLHNDDSLWQISSSLANLGALLTFDLKRHEDAESILLRSADIIRGQLGPASSGALQLQCRRGVTRCAGLQFNYRSLINVYTHLGKRQQAARYQQLLDEWRLLQQSKPRHERPAGPMERFDAVAAVTLRDLLK